MTFFFDENFPPVIAQVLRLLDVDARHLTGQFPSGTLDVDWIPQIGARGWVLLTGDRHIRTRHTELTALEKAGVTAFLACRKSNHMQLQDRCFWLLTAWRRIEQTAEDARPGAWFEINSSGTPQKIARKR